MSIIDGRRFEQDGEQEEGLDACELLHNKQGQPLLAHGRSGSYSDVKRVVVPMIVSACAPPARVPAAHRVPMLPCSSTASPPLFSPPPPPPSSSLQHGQAVLPDLKVTDSSEALLTGRAPPFRLLVRAVRRTGDSVSHIRFALSEPFVVATARVKGAAKLEIPHMEDHVSKIDCLGVQTQARMGQACCSCCGGGPLPPRC